MTILAVEGWSKKKKTTLNQFNSKQFKVRVAEESKGMKFLCLKIKMKRSLHLEFGDATHAIIRITTLLTVKNVPNANFLDIEKKWNNNQK